MNLKRTLGKYLQRSVRFPWVRLRGRRNLIIRMDTTNRCNLRCSMCSLRLADKDPDRKWHDIDPDLFNKIATELFPKASVVGLSCGAELFVNPDFGRYLDILYQADVPVREVVTNGILLTSENIGVLLESPPTSLFVSIDGATPPTHARIRGGADLDLIIGNMMELVCERDRRRMRFPTLSFSVTLQRSNLHELPEIVKLASRVGAVSVGVVPLIPFSGLDMTGETIDPDSPEVFRQIRLASDIASELGLSFNFPSASSPEKLSSCPYLDNWVYIDPDGRINPCPHWNTSEPLGDMSRNSFHEIWNGPAYMALRDRISRGVYTSNCAVCPEMSQSGSEIPKS
ncbi:MAG: radical SAM protein [Candidatus Aegiribacteria sp.]|nr:radical SAM protein [Candidatus Aegiribacteria sp.]